MADPGAGTTEPEPSSLQDPTAVLWWPLAQARVGPASPQPSLIQADYRIQPTMPAVTGGAFPRQTLPEEVWARQNFHLRPLPRLPQEVWQRPTVVEAQPEASTEISPESASLGEEGPAGAVGPLTPRAPATPRQASPAGEQVRGETAAAPALRRGLQQDAWLRFRDPGLEAAFRYSWAQRQALPDKMYNLMSSIIGVIRIRQVLHITRQDWSGITVLAVGFIMHTTYCLGSIYVQHLNRPWFEGRRAAIAAAGSIMRCVYILMISTCMRSPPANGWWGGHGLIYALVIDGGLACGAFFLMGERNLVAVWRWSTPACAALIYAATAPVVRPPPSQ